MKDIILWCIPFDSIKERELFEKQLIVDNFFELMNIYKINKIIDNSMVICENGRTFLLLKCKVFEMGQIEKR